MALMNQFGPRSVSVAAGACVSLSVVSAAIAQAPAAAPQPVLQSEAKAPAMEPLRAVVTEMRGAIQIRPAGAEQWQPAEIGMVLGEGAQIRTGVRSRLTIRIGSGQTVDLFKMGQFTLTQMVRDQATGDTKPTDVARIDVDYGALASDVKEVDAKNDLQVRTPDSTLAVQGTRFTVIADSRGTRTFGQYRDLPNNGSFRFTSSSGKTAVVVGTQQSSTSNISTAGNAQVAASVVTADKDALEQEEQNALENRSGNGTLLTQQTSPESGQINPLIGPGKPNLERLQAFGATLEFITASALGSGSSDGGSDSGGGGLPTPSPNTPDTVDISALVQQVIALLDQRFGSILADIYGIRASDLTAQITAFLQSVDPSVAEALARAIGSGSLPGIVDLFDLEFETPDSPYNRLAFGVEGSNGSIEFIRVPSNVFAGTPAFREFLPGIPSVENKAHPFRNGVPSAGLALRSVSPGAFQLFFSLNDPAFDGSPALYTRFLSVSSDISGGLTLRGDSGYQLVGQLPSTLTDPQGLAFVDDKLLVLPFEGETGTTIYSVAYENVPGIHNRGIDGTLAAEPWLDIPGFFFDPDALAENPRNKSVFIVSSGGRPMPGFSNGSAGAGILEIRTDVFAIVNTYQDVAGSLNSGFLDITGAGMSGDLLFIEGFSNGQPFSAALDPSRQPGSAGFVVDVDSLDSNPYAGLTGSSFGDPISAPTIITNQAIINQRIAASPIDGPDMSLPESTRNLAYTSRALHQSDLIEGLVVDHVINRIVPNDMTQCRIALLGSADVRNSFENFADLSGGLGLAASAVGHYADALPECD